MLDPSFDLEVTAETFRRGIAHLPDDICGHEACVRLEGLWWLGCVASTGLVLVPGRPKARAGCVALIAVVHVGREG